MRFMLQLMLFTGIGAVLLAVNLWFVLTVASVFRSGHAVLIRPFRVVSSDTSQRQDGEVLAQVALARLTALVSLLASARPHTLLEPYRSATPAASVIPTTRIHSPLEILPHVDVQPRSITMAWRSRVGISKLPAFTFKAGPLEVEGFEGVLEALADLFKPQYPEIHVVVLLSSVTLQVVIEKTAPTDQRTMMTVDRPEDLINAVTYTILRQELGGWHPRFLSVTWFDLRDFLESLEAYVEDHAKIAQGVPRSRETLEALHHRLARLDDRVPQWQDMLLLRATIAADLGHFAEAQRDLERARDVLAQTNRRVDLLDHAIEQYRSRERALEDPPTQAQTASDE